MSADDRIQQLAPKILDDAPIDWERDTEGLDPDSIEELRALAALVRLHRELPDPVATGASADIAPARSLGQWGPLRLIERIGEGAFGEVFRAWDTRLDREVALKLLTASPDSDKGGLIIRE